MTRSNSASWRSGAATASASRRWRGTTRRWRRSVPEHAAQLSDEQLDTLGEDYNTAINICGAPELAGPAVSERPDRDATDAAASAKPGAVWFDDLLTPPALAGLKRYLLESTIWHDFSHIGGFVASYLEDGLACPLLLQIVDEIRGAFPDLLGKHPLTQAWAFKGLKAKAAIDAHADDAAISINFWATPDDANTQSRSRRLDRLPRRRRLPHGRSRTTTQTGKRSRSSWSGTQATT